jgi:hypothetical protein
VFDLTTNQQLLQERILVDSVVHGFEARENRKSGWFFIRDICLFV